MKKPFIFEGRDKTMRTGHEKIAMRNIKWACYNIVGMAYNDYQDGNIKYLPTSYEELRNIIYDSAMNDLYAEGYEGSGKAPKEMRFAGEAFCRAYIDYVLKNDENVCYDVEEIGEVAKWKWVVA